MNSPGHGLSLDGTMMNLIDCTFPVVCRSSSVTQMSTIFGTIIIQHLHPNKMVRIDLNHWKAVVMKQMIVVNSVHFIYTYMKPGKEAATVFTVTGSKYLCAIFMVH